MERPQIPGPLRAVAVIQLLGGLAAAVGIIVQLTDRRIDLDFGVLGIPIYFGLMRWSNGWRTCALVFLWAGMLLAPVAFFLGLSARTPATFQVFGVPLADLSAIWLSVLSVPFFLLNVWQYRVLTQPEIRSSFLQTAATQPAS